MLPCRAGGLTLCWHHAPPSPAGGPAWLGRSGGSFGCKQGPFGNSEARCCLSVPSAAGLWELLVQVGAVLLLGVQGQRSRSSRVPVLRCQELWRRQQEALVLWFCSSMCLWRDEHGLGHVWGELGVPRAPTRWGQHRGHALSRPGAQQGARCGSGLVAGGAGCAGGSRQQLQSLGCGACGSPLGVPKGQPQEQDEGTGPCVETSSCAEPYMGMGPRVPLGAGAGTREVGSAVEETLAKPSLSLVTGAQGTCRGVTGVLSGCAGAQTGPQGDGGDAWVCWCGCARRWGLPVRGCPSSTSSDFWPLSKDRQDFAGRTLVVWPHPLPAVTRLSPRSSHGRQQRRHPSHGPPPGEPPAGSVWEQRRVPGSVPCPPHPSWYPLSHGARMAAGQFDVWCQPSHSSCTGRHGFGAGAVLVRGAVWVCRGAKCVAPHCRTVVLSGHGGGLVHGAGGVGTRGCVPSV